MCIKRSSRTKAARKIDAHVFKPVTLILLNRIHLDIMLSTFTLLYSSSTSRRATIIREFGVFWVCAMAVKEDGVGDKRDHVEDPDNRLDMNLLTLVDG